MQRSITEWLLRLGLASTALLTPAASAQGTAFTYQGKLNDSGSPAAGIYDLEFTVFSADAGGALIAGPLTNASTPVSGGLFTVTLDFGPVFNGSNYWLEIGARTNGAGSFTTLSPRQVLTPAPYAIYAATAGSAASMSGALILTNPSNQFIGTFTGNGSGLSNGATGLPLADTSVTNGLASASYVAALGVTGHTPNPTAWQARVNAAIQRTTTFTTYGDSVTAGYSDSQTNVNWPFLVASNNSWTLFNFAVGGMKIGDASTNIALNALTNAGPTNAFGIAFGLNDYASDTTLTNTNAFGSALMGAILQYEFGTGIFSCCWSNGITLAGSWGSNSAYPLCAYVVNSNATATASVYGSTVAIEEADLGSFGTGFSVNIDGTNYGAIPTWPPLFNASPQIWYDGFLFTNLPLAWHTVVLTAQNVEWGGTAGLSFIAGVDPLLPTAPLAVVINILPPAGYFYGSSTPAELASYNQMIFNVCQQLDYAGLPVVMADVSSPLALITNTYVNPPFHPGTFGEGVMANAVLDTVGTSGSTTSVTIETNSSGPHGYILQFNKGLFMKAVEY